MSTEPRIIFDNGGGTTLQLPGFSRHYQNPKFAAEDYASWLTHRHTVGWEGNDPEAAALDPEPEEIRNGGYRVLSPEEVEDAAFTSEAYGWRNIERFLEALEAADAPPAGDPLRRAYEADRSGVADFGDLIM